MLTSNGFLISIQALYDYKSANINTNPRTEKFQFKHCTIISHLAERS